MNGIKTSLLLLFAASISLSGCATPTTTRLADGTLVYRINCDGGAGGLNYCFGRAGKTCGADGFTILDNDGTVIATSDVAGGDVETVVSLHSYDESTMLVKCGT